MPESDIVCMKEDIAAIKSDIGWIKSTLTSMASDTETKAKVLALETERVRESFQTMYSNLEDKFGQYKSDQDNKYNALKEKFDKSDFWIKMIGSAASFAALYILGRILGLVVISADKI